MVASGHNIGDNIVIRAVETDTLKPGDKIVFYCYTPINKTFDINSCSVVPESEIGDLKYKKITFSSMLGLQSNEIKLAGKANSTLVFHHIKAVYVDSSGQRWFSTYGSSNNQDDVALMGYINENLVVGVYINTPFARFMASLTKGMSSTAGIIVLFVPIILMAMILVYECIKDIQRAKLEYDCVEEKRKITDPICVKYQVGYNMDTKTKYKILAQATEDQKIEYLSYLWKDGSTPNGIKKYLLRKNCCLEAIKNFCNSIVSVKRCLQMVKIQIKLHLIILLANNK